MRLLELLAPAKNLEYGIAAIDHGADAVYIGAQRFGARAAAGNSVDDIRLLCAYAHQFSAKVFVTVNTIIYDNETEALRELLSGLDNAGVDAILIQDMSVLDLVRRHPSLSLHASTQADNRSVEKVSWLRSQGFSRAVLARELSLDEVSAIHRAEPGMELEVFVHGALCVSYSGLCYASEYCFGRSANRGECAQFCRLPFTLVDADGRVVERNRHLLSLKDLNLSDHLLELAEAGATSFKIEGRLKDLAYVKNVTAAYSQLLDNIVRQHPDRYRRASRGRVAYTFQPDLRKTFNRGYTTYFLNGRQPNIASFDTPKAIGETIGRVKSLHRDSIVVSTTARFSNGDGLCFIDGDRQLVGFRVNRAEGNRLYPFRMPQGLQAGTVLYRNSDQEMERLLSKPSARRRIPVALTFGITPTGYSLSGDGVEVSVECAHEQAAKPQRENIVRQLSRLGDTIFEASGVDLPQDFPYFVPNSVLAELRAKWKDAPRPRQPRPLPATEATASNRTASAPVPEGTPLMQCRHCLRYALGHCTKRGGTRAAWREPLSLVLGDGRRFPLEFDCANCQMNVCAPART